MTNSCCDLVSNTSCGWMCASGQVWWWDVTQSLTSAQSNLYRPGPGHCLLVVAAPVSWYSGPRPSSALVSGGGVSRKCWKCQTSLTWSPRTWPGPESGFSSHLVNTSSPMNRLLVITFALLGKFRPITVSFQTHYLIWCFYHPWSNLLYLDWHTRRNTTFIILVTWYFSTKLF